MLLAGDVDLVIEYNGDIAQVMREDPDLDFVVPREGGILASDGLCIPRCAQPRSGPCFHQFRAGRRAGRRHRPHDPLSHPQRGRLALMPDSYRKSPVIFPPPPRSQPGRRYHHRRAAGPGRLDQSGA
jgi:spermidine/putrescine transport system substrate-binding protein